MVAEVLDLLQELPDAHGGILLATPSQVVAVGVDQGGPVLRGLLQLLGLGDAGIALDGAQRRLQAAGAFRQADALVEHGVDPDVPPEHALLTVDMQEYSKLPEAKMASARADLDSMLTTVFAQCGIGGPPLLGAVKDRGDGAIFMLPARHAARLIDPLLVHLGQALERREQTRLASAPTIRLRASVHVGPLAPPEHRGDAANDACRLIDSDVARRAMTAAVDHGVLLAAVVSDTLFGRTVAAGRTPALKEQHFHRATARVEGKPGFEQTCWLLLIVSERDRFSGLAVGVAGRQSSARVG